MVFELIWTSNDVDIDDFYLNGVSAVETIHNLSNKTFNKYSRLVIQFTKSTNTSPNHLYIDIKVKMKSGISYPNELQTYMVCYGIKGLQSDVPSNVYDALWSVNNSKVTFNETIDMGNNKITGVADGTDNNDVVNKSQLNIVKNRTTVNDHNITTINNIITKYYYSDRLHHNKGSNILFTIKSGQKISVSLNNIHVTDIGYYQVIYNDYYKGGGVFRIRQDSQTGDILYDNHFYIQNDYTPISINAIFKVEKQNTTLFFSLQDHTFVDTNLLGRNYSSFYIKFLHA